jgi:hypothetical protein
MRGGVTDSNGWYGWGLAKPSYQSVVSFPAGLRFSTMLPKAKIRPKNLLGGFDFRSPARCIFNRPVRAFS